MVLLLWVYDMIQEKIGSRFILLASVHKHVSLSNNV